MQAEPFNPPVIVDAHGQPARKRLAQDDRCPRCKAGKDQRVASGAFGGDPHPICRGCGHEFLGEPVGESR